MGVSVDELIQSAERWDPLRWEHQYLCGSYKKPTGFFKEPEIWVRDKERSLHHDHHSYRKSELTPETQRQLKVEVFAAMTIALQRFLPSVALDSDSSTIVWLCTYPMSNDSEWLERESARFLNPKTRYDQFAAERGYMDASKNSSASSLFREILSEHAGYMIEPGEESQHRNPARIAEDKETEKRTLLIREIMRQYDLEEFETLPLVRFEQFFDDNFDEQSIAANAVWKEIPNLDGIFAELRRISELPTVADVYVTIHECPEEDDEEDLNIWPQAEGLVVITTLGRESLQSELSALKPDFCYEGWAYDGHEATRPVPELEEGYWAYTIGWD
ncbi:hypothetical protein Mal15_62600 [Stieleria maiorica]|uniref:Uncharacterized protein n=2 Tax=Stieleria maiorica TaxID=2795974 RepID=A0A5B9MQP2_9BACT|nr:hypothetical protein Mal15_62600 [Stieleria maiorica]